MEGASDWWSWGSSVSEAGSGIGSRLSELLAEGGLAALSPEQLGQFEEYYLLFIHWSSRVNLTSIRGEENILSRHFVESIACARALPAGICTLVDFGSGGGFPGVPIAICRREIAVTLAESQGKKAAFLQEVVRSVGISAKVHAQRAELLGSGFDCVTLRAVDKMGSAVSAAARLVVPGGWLAVMTTTRDVAGLQAAAGAGFSWTEAHVLPGGGERVLALGERMVNFAA